MGSEEEREGPPTLDEIGQTLYGEIRVLAAQRIDGDRAERSISATDFAHEILARGLKHKSLQGVSETELMRRIGRLAREILVDRARARQALKRGGAEVIHQLAVDPTAAPGASQLDLLALDEALHKLERLDARQMEILQLRYFAGCTVPEVADALGVSVSTVEKEERRARAWLKARLEDEPDCA